MRIYLYATARNGTVHLMAPGAKTLAICGSAPMWRSIGVEQTDGDEATCGVCRRCAEAEAGKRHRAHLASLRRCPCPNDTGYYIVNRATRRRVKPGHPNAMTVCADCGEEIAS